MVTRSVTRSTTVAHILRENLRTMRDFSFEARLHWGRYGSLSSLSTSRHTNICGNRTRISLIEIHRIDHKARGRCVYSGRPRTMRGLGLTEVRRTNINLQTKSVIQQNYDRYRPNYNVLFIVVVLIHIHSTIRLFVLT